MPDVQLLLEPWLLAFVLASGLALGCLGLLMVGHLLGESWLHPVRSELEAGARTVPLAGLLGVPLAFGLADLYPWAASEPLAGALLPPARAAYLEPTFFLARSAAYFVLWTALARWITRRGEHPRVAALGLALLVPTVGLASIDWIKSRELEWWSTLYPLAFSVTQLLGAMALAILVTLVRPGHVPA
ncbi:MAG TPA: hypothetical protein VFG43_03280, partial [Geminicoccaceae bacterium]|nr:hypothetical protein [Geminicoccaceae bacterium]